jgi:hypothetical protein
MKNAQWVREVPVPVPVQSRHLTIAPASSVSARTYRFAPTTDASVHAGIFKTELYGVMLR